MAGTYADKMEISPEIGDYRLYRLLPFGRPRIPRGSIDWCCMPRIGNAGIRQVQLDKYGELLDLAWRWHQRGRSPESPADADVDQRLIDKKP